MPVRHHLALLRGDGEKDGSMASPRSGSILHSVAPPSFPRTPPPPHDTRPATVKTTGQQE